MIRHSSSLLISVVIHLILLSLIIISYKKIYTPKKEVCESRVCMELCVLKAQKELKKVKPKKIEKKKEPKKSKVKKVEKKQIVKKKVEVKKIKPLIIPVVQKVEEPEPIKEKMIETLSETSSFEEVQEIKKEVVEIKIVKKSAKEIEDEERLRKENLVKEYIQINTYEISKLLKENLYYPRSARKRGITGRIVVKFVLSVDAEVSNVEVLKSKSKILSRAAIKTIQNLSGEFPRPKEDITLHVPIGYTLK